MTDTTNTTDARKTIADTIMGVRAHWPWPWVKDWERHKALKEADRFISDLGRDGFEIRPREGQDHG